MMQIENISFRSSNTKKKYVRVTLECYSLSVGPCVEDAFAPGVPGTVRQEDTSPRHSRKVRGYTSQKHHRVSRFWE